VIPVIHRVIAVFSIRPVVAEQKPSENNQLRLLVADIKTCRDRITGILNKSIHGPDETLRIKSLLHTLTVFEVEFAAYLQEWDNLLQTIAVVHSESSAVVTFEAIADILWAEKECPVHGRRDLLYCEI